MPKEYSPADFNRIRIVLLGIYESPMTLTKVACTYIEQGMPKIMSLTCVGDRIPSLARVVCTVNLSEPVEITSSDHPYDHKYWCFYILS